MQQLQSDKDLIFGNDAKTSWNLENCEIQWFKRANMCPLCLNGYSKNYHSLVTKEEIVKSDKILVLVPLDFNI